MYKYVFLGLGLLLTLSFVFAGYAVVEFLGSSGDYKITYEVTIKKGWNLLPANLGAWSITNDTPEAEVLQKIKAYYVYLPLQNKYVNALGGFSEQDFKQVQQNQQYLQSSAAWYYVTDEIILSYIAEDGGMMPKLNQGWNLLSIGPSLSVLNSAVKSSNKFPIGNCEIKKLYLWDSYKQIWDNVGADSVDELSDKDAVGAGVAIKVNSSCQLGVSEATPNIPSLPSN